VKVDYRKLKGKIKEVFDTQNAFADALGLSYTSLNLKINDKRDWTISEIMKACELLNIQPSDAYLYFFNRKV
jgi:DNA-binding XRE family transcriptional regulator